MLYAAPEDYKFTATDIVFRNTSQVSLTVPIAEDALLELNETFKAEISLVRTEDKICVLLQPASVDVTILDNDSE